MKFSHLFKEKPFMSYSLFFFLISMLFVIDCSREKEKKETLSSKTELPEPSAENLNLSVAITMIDNEILNLNQTPQVGRQVIVEGTISDPKAIICVLVHPLSGDTWWVQNMPSPPGKIDEKTWRWRTMVYFGTEELGINEEFEIVAIAEFKRAVCQVGKTINMIDFPFELPRSEIITVKRVRN